MNVAASCHAMHVVNARKWACISYAPDGPGNVEASPSVPLSVCTGAVSLAGMAAGVPPLLSTAMLLADTRMAALLPVHAHGGHHDLARRDAQISSSPCTSGHSRDLAICATVVQWSLRHAVAFFPVALYHISSSCAAIL